MKRIPLLDAVEMLRAKRGCFLTNPFFQKQLRLLAAEEGLLGERPKGYTNKEPVEKETKEVFDDRW